MFAFVLGIIAGRGLGLLLGELLQFGQGAFVAFLVVDVVGGEFDCIFKALQCFGKNCLRILLGWSS